MKNKSVLFVGHCYYNPWFLSRSLREFGWKADLINIDLNPANQKYYWGQDIFLPNEMKARVELFINSLNEYSIFHFSNRNGLCFIQFNQKSNNLFKNLIRFSFFLLLWFLCRFVFRYNTKLIGRMFILLKMAKEEPQFEFSLSDLEFQKLIGRYTTGFPANWDIYLLKALGKKIVYSNNGCNDGVTPTSFSKWGPSNVCQSVCAWFGTNVCTDKASIEWGKFRNFIADYIIILGGNRADFNKTNKAHEVPEFYCLDSEHWKPELDIPEKYRLNTPDDVVKIYHSVGNYDSRTKNGVNIKCTHIYFPLIEELKSEGYKVELVFCHDIPNTDVRYIMAQCDLVVDMLTFGWFGANIRESMMQGIPSVCFLRPEWLEDARKEIPEYVKNLPVVSATPETIKAVLIDLINDKHKRLNLGKASREFAVNWHSKEIAAKKFDQIYSSLL